TRLRPADVLPNTVAARAESVVAPMPEATTPLRGSGSRTWRREGAAAAGAPALAIAGSAFGWLYSHRPSDQTASRAAASLSDASQPPAVQGLPAMINGRTKGIVALAVMPFTSYGESGEAARFADMMTDDLTSVLG